MQNKKSKLPSSSIYLKSHLNDNYSLIDVLNTIILSVKEISKVILNGDINNILGNLSTQNVQGETQKKLDVFSNDIFIKNLSNNKDVYALVSEENEKPIFINKSNKGKYVIFFDPLDGSSNIDVNGVVGSIFSIYRVNNENTNNNLLSHGSDQLVAGYSLYGPSTMLILTLDKKVDCFTLNHDKTEFFLTHKNLTISQETNEYSINSSNERFWEPPITRYISECRDGKTGIREKDFNMRWTGSMVADVHRILMRGGIFMYPKDNKVPKKEGRLRLMYEANPMALIIERAGGLATTGRDDLLSVNPSTYHQRASVIIGAADEVSRIKKYYLQYDKGEDKEFTSPLFKNRTLFSEGP